MLTASRRSPHRSRRGGNPAALVNTWAGNMISPSSTTGRVWDEIVNLNFMGPVPRHAGVLDSMIAAGTGAIVNVASDAGARQHGETIYAGAKGGVIAFTKSLAREMPHGIRVNCICPATDTTLCAPNRKKCRTPSCAPSVATARAAIGDADAIAFFASNARRSSRSGAQRQRCLTMVG